MKFPSPPVRSGDYRDRDALGAYVPGDRVIETTPITDRRSMETRYHEVFHGAHSASGQDYSEQAVQYVAYTIERFFSAAEPSYKGFVNTRRVGTPTPFVRWRPGLLALRGGPQAFKEFLIRHARLGGYVLDLLVHWFTIYDSDASSSNPLI